MINIDEAFVESEAANAGAIKNGRALHLKNKITSRNKCKSDEVLFGNCAGSGKTPYYPSADFINRSKPVYRCSCPSRQIPCKHVVALLFSYTAGDSFDVSDLPDDLTEKRSKAEKRVEKKKITAAVPKKINKAALAKKITIQLEAIDKMEQMIHDVISSGLGNLTEKSIKQIIELAKLLGESYLPGAQNSLRDLTYDIYDYDQRSVRDQNNGSFNRAVDQINRLQSLCDKGRKYLKERLADSELCPDTSSDIAAQLGHVWQLSELKTAECIQTNVELIQLAFNTYNDVARQEIIDEACWLNLETGAVQLSFNYRPYRALNHIKEEDSFSKVAVIQELAVYPGNLNPRVRWDGADIREISSTDIDTVYGYAHAAFAGVLKLIKGQLRSPLSDKEPLALLKVKRIGLVDDVLVAEDKSGERLGLSDCTRRESDSCQVLSVLPKELLEDTVLLVRFSHDLDSRTLQAKPLAVIKDSIIRLTY